jgi:hypothetical protein
MPETLQELIALLGTIDGESYKMSGTNLLFYRLDIFRVIKGPHIKHLN